jgi:hypothetical protein
MRDAVRQHFVKPPAGSKLQAAIDFGVDISLMDPPQFSDRSGYRADRGFREILDALHEHRVECVIIGGLAMLLRGSTRVTLDIDVIYKQSFENAGRLLKAVGPFAPRLRLARGEKLVEFSFSERAIINGGQFNLWTPDFDIDLFTATEDFSSYEAAAEESLEVETNRGRKFRIPTLEALLRTNKRRNRVDDQLALPEIEALIEIRDLGREQS